MGHDALARELQRGEPLGANLGESQVLKANSGLFVLAVSFVVSGLP